MTNATFLQSLTNPSAPATDSPYLETDWAIRRNVTKALFDVSNALTTVNSGVFVTGNTLNNLVSGGSGATIAGPGSGTAIAAVYNGTLRTLGAASFGAVTLPGDGYFYIPTAQNRVLITFWLRAVKTGWTAGALCGLIGAGTGTGASTQYVMYLQDSSGSDGVIDLAVVRLRGAAANIDCNLNGSGLDALLDGSLHQVGILLEISGGLGRASLYVDEVLAAQSGQASMTTFNRPVGSTAVLFAGPGISYLATNNAALDTRIGRPAVHYLTDSTITVADILARETQAAAGFLS